jgi:3-hydroxyisobutyrate dehydrogenase
VRVGFIGVGNLGAHLAASLVRAGFEVTVHDRDERAAAALLAAGASWASSPQETAERTDSVITCLPTPAAVAAVVTGEAGILAGLARGGTWIDMSTNDAGEVKRLASIAAERGVGCLEAPVTGGVHKAVAGEITVLVGGDATVFEAHRPVIEAMGRPVLHVGPLGSASVLKVITNMLAFVHLVAAGEALALAKRGGLDLAAAFEAIKASSGSSFVFETEGQLIHLACKDLLLALQLGRELRTPLDLGATVEQTFIRARERYGGAAPSTMAVKLLEDALDLELRAPGFPARLY